MLHSFKNIVRLKVIAKALAELSIKAVFVGGAVVDLYADDPTRGEVRPTDDIDVVIEVVSRHAYHQIEEKLRSIGFKNDIMSGVICRYKYHDIVVDIMPDDGTALGFTNNWYKSGIRTSISFHLDDEISIQIFSVAHFLASKLEALQSERHGADYRFNSDFEDIIYVFDNRTTILDDIMKAEVVLYNYLKLTISKLLNRSFIEEEITANLESSNQVFRLNRILSIWRTIVH